MIHIELFLLFFSVFSLKATMAASLPKGLVDSDVDRVVQVVGLSGASRLMRSAESYDSFPGLKIGFEVIMISSRDLNSLGTGGGTVPSFCPTPRLYLAKGIIYDSEITLNFFPPTDANPITTLGAIIKHTFFQERDTWSVGGIFRSYAGTGVRVSIAALTLSLDLPSAGITFA